MQARLSKMHLRASPNVIKTRAVLKAVSRPCMLGKNEPYFPN